MTKPLPVSLAEPALTSTSTTLGSTRAATPASEPARLDTGAAPGDVPANTIGPLAELPPSFEAMPIAAPIPPARRAMMITSPNTMGTGSCVDVHRRLLPIASVGSSQLHFDGASGPDDSSPLGCADDVAGAAGVDFDHHPVALSGLSAPTSGSELTTSSGWSLTQRFSLAPARSGTPVG